MIDNTEFPSSNSIKFSSSIEDVFEILLRKNEDKKIFLVVDSNTLKYCWSILKPSFSEKRMPELIILEAGESHKNLQAVNTIWDALYDKGADRNSLLINLGGGVVGDIGGFAASTYMRGIDYIQVPTSLLAMVDASVGSKTGFNFNNIKNGIGLFANPQAVIIHTNFLKTLPKDELLSGFAELVKHAIVEDVNLWNAIQEKTLTDINWEKAIKHSVEIKQKIVKHDMLETGERKKLNFGHTIGHALEMYFLKRGSVLKHGFAVAAGIICETHISAQMNHLKIDHQKQITDFILLHFPKITFDDKDIEEIVDLIRFDKKNLNGQNQFTLINKIGSSDINKIVSIELIIESLQFYLAINR